MHLGKFTSGRASSGIGTYLRSSLRVCTEYVIPLTCGLRIDSMSSLFEIQVPYTDERSLAGIRTAAAKSPGIERYLPVVRDRRGARRLTP